MQTRYRVDYKTETVPVTRFVIDQIPTVEMTTEYKQEYKTETLWS